MKGGVRGRPVQGKEGHDKKGMDKAGQYLPGQGGAVTTQRLGQVKTGHPEQEKTR